MKTFRTTKGPFKERPYYTNQEIENVCTDELRAVGLYPTTPGPIRIDRFVEKRFGVTPIYEDLAEGVLGFTKFGPKGVQAIVVARSLDEDGTTPAERRIRTTVAHEAGHGLLHAHLFLEVSENGSLFGDFSDPTAPKVLCRDVPNDSTSHAPYYDGRWWEFQANRTIGALLLPQPLVHVALESLLTASGSLGIKTLERVNREKAARLLADTFEVNPVVAKIRLGELFPVATEAQLRL
jgi:hypothetical protein